jgi:hypothetical protein
MELLVRSYGWVVLALVSFVVLAWLIERRARQHGKLYDSKVQTLLEENEKEQALLQRLSQTTRQLAGIRAAVEFGVISILIVLFLIYASVL